MSVSLNDDSFPLGGNGSITITGTCDPGLMFTIRVTRQGYNQSHNVSDANNDAAWSQVFTGISAGQFSVSVSAPGKEIQQMITVTN